MASYSENGRTRDQFCMLAGTWSKDPCMAHSWLVSWFQEDISLPCLDPAMTYRDYWLAFQIYCDLPYLASLLPALSYYNCFYVMVQTLRAENTTGGAELVAQHQIFHYTLSPQKNTLQVSIWWHHWVPTRYCCVLGHQMFKEMYLSSYSCDSQCLDPCYSCSIK